MILVFIAALYGQVDYSLKILKDATKKNMINRAAGESLQRSLIKYCRSLNYKFFGRGILRESARFVQGIVENDYGGWASGENHLGSRKKWGIFY